MNFGDTIYGLGSHGWTSIPWQACESYLHPLGNDQTYNYKSTKKDRNRTIEVVKFSQNTNTWLTALKIASYILTVFTLPLAALMIKGLYRATHKIEIYSGGGGKPSSLNSNNANPPKPQPFNPMGNAGTQLKPNNNSSFNNFGFNNNSGFNNNPSNINYNYNTNFSNYSSIDNKFGFNNNSSPHHASPSLNNPSPQIKPIGNPVSKPKPEPIKPEQSGLQLLNPELLDLELLAHESTFIDSIENSIEHNSLSFMNIRELIDTGEVKLNDVQEEMMTCPVAYEPYVSFKVNNDLKSTMENDAAPVFLIQEGVSASYGEAQAWYEVLEKRMADYEAQRLKAIQDGQAPPTKVTKTGLTLNISLDTFSFAKNIGLIKQARVIDNELCWVEPITGAKLGEDGFKNPYFFPLDGYTYDLATFKKYISEQYEKGVREIPSPANPAITFEFVVELYPNKDFFKLVASKNNVAQPQYKEEIIPIPIPAEAMNNV